MSIPSRIDAIVLDVDGTLYRLGPVRRQMALRLAGACVTQPLRTRRAVRVIRAFRANLETISGFASVEEILEASHARPVVPILPWVEATEVGPVLKIDPAAGYPTNSEPIRP